MNRKQEVTAGPTTLGGTPVAVPQQFTPVAGTPVSGSASYPEFQGKYEYQEFTLEELTQCWYFRPLELLMKEVAGPDGLIADRFSRPNGNPRGYYDRYDNGFAVLSLLFPLIERHLRYTHHYTDNFCWPGSKALLETFSAEATDGTFPSSAAYAMWQLFRNGILHCATPGNKPGSKQLTTSTFEHEGIEYLWETIPELDAHQPVYLVKPLMESNRLIIRIAPIPLARRMLRILRDDKDMWTWDKVSGLPDVGTMM